MKNRILASALAVLVVLSLTACMKTESSQSDGMTSHENPAASVPRETASPPLTNNADSTASPTSNEEVIYSGHDFDIIRHPFIERGELMAFEVGTGADKRYGFIRVGEEGLITEAVFDQVMSFSEGLCAVRAYDPMSGESKWGFIDESGNTVIDLKYDDVQNPNDWRNTGGLIFSGGYALVAVGRGSNIRWGLVDKTGTEVVPVEFHNIHGTTIKDGFITVSGAGDLVGKYDMQNGRLVIPVENWTVGDFSDGLCVAYKIDSNDVIRHIANWYDTSGNIVFSREGGGSYDGYNFSEGIAVDNIWLTDRANMPVEAKIFMNKAGEHFGDVFLAATPFKNGFSIVHGTDETGKFMLYGYADTAGKLAIPYRFNRANPFDHGLAVVADANWENYLINEEGIRVSDFILDTAVDDHPFYEGLKKVRTNKAWGFIDTTGKLIADGFYDTGVVSDGLIAVQRQQESKWGYISAETGETAIPYIFDYAGIFSGGVAFARKADTPKDTLFQFLGLIYYPFCIIDSAGNQLTEHQYIGVARDSASGRMSLSQSITPFSHGSTVVAVADGDGTFSYYELEIVKK